jgi:hypothetical protein
LPALVVLSVNIRDGQAPELAGKYPHPGGLSGAPPSAQMGTALKSTFSNSMIPFDY